ncbi:MAG: hypothetical protein KGJ13_02955 [Patescibacteria group bacterium]|nr:hypothetical protein [Patescibacteria group bacterium]
MKKGIHNTLYIILYTLILIPFFAFASGSDGTIDSTSKYAWGDYLGWVNFGATNGNVQVTKSTLAGYVWSENYGWINLSPAGSGVTNNCSGQLGGYAWGENTGYINFGGVSINGSGKFTGEAVVLGLGSSGSSTLGEINFDCSNCAVQTDWRASVACAAGGGPGGGGGGGGGGGTGYYGSSSVPVMTSTPPVPPQSTRCDNQAKIGDFNCDGKVNLVDLSIFLYYYGRSGPSVARYDLDHNGTVDFPDISIMMYHWTG